MMRKNSVFAKCLIFAIVCLFLIGGMTYEYVSALERGFANQEVDESINGRGTTAGLYISSGVANASTRIVNSDTSVTRITCVMSLQKYQNGAWVNVESWYKTSASTSVYLSGSKSVTRGKYRVRSRIAIYKGSGIDTIEIYSQTVAY